jgi:hypothetical protein
LNSERKVVEAEVRCFLHILAADCDTKPDGMNLAMTVLFAWNNSTPEYIDDPPLYMTSNSLEPEHLGHLHSSSCLENAEPKLRYSLALQQAKEPYEATILGR